MGRPKAFDHEAALAAAKALFWKQGYTATSTEDLRLAMGIGRQSFYDSFGGKRELFLEVLRRYNAEGVSDCEARIAHAGSPFAALEELLLSFSRDPPGKRTLGCLGVSTMCELGVHDPDVAVIGASNSSRLERLLEDLVSAAKDSGAVRSSVKERAAARHLSATIIGMKVMGKAGATARELRDVATAALDGLAAPACSASRGRAAIATPYPASSVKKTIS